MEFDYEPNLKSKKFYEFLRNKILTENYKPGDKFYSIREIVKKYNVGNVTVSTAISNLTREGLLYTEHGRGTFIGDIEKIDKEIKLVGLILFNFRRFYDVEIGDLEVIQQILRPNCFVIPYSIDNDMNKFYKALRGLKQLDIRGIIASVPTSGDYDVEYIKDIIGDTPVVFENRRIPGINASFVSLDYELGGYIATKHLLEKNRKRIAFINSISTDIASRIYSGYKRALDEAGIPVKQDYIIDIEHNDIIEGRLDTAIIPVEKKLLSLSGEIDGIFSNELALYKLNEFFTKTSIKVPEDISLVGFGNLWFSQYMLPPLTTVEYPRYELSSVSAKTIKDMMNKKDEEREYKNIILKPNLIVRKSS